MQSLAYSKCTVSVVGKQDGGGRPSRGGGGRGGVDNRAEQQGASGRPRLLDCGDPHLLERSWGPHASPPHDLSDLQHPSPSQPPRAVLNTVRGPCSGPGLGSGWPSIPGKPPALLPPVPKGDNPCGLLGPVAVSLPVLLPSTEARASSFQHLPHRPTLPLEALCSLLPLLLALPHPFIQERDSCWGPD